MTLIERETLDSALMSARSVLELLGWQPHQARNAGAALSPPQRRAAASRWRRTARTRRKLIAAAKQGRQQLEELFAQEREQAAERQARGRLERRRADAQRARRRRRPAIAQSIRQASSNGSRGLRANTFDGSPWPRLQMKFVLTVVPAQNAASILAASKPLIGPQSRPSARAAMMK